ncbi:Nicotinate-nucleotide adenylyltransferase [Vibrio chagasii]|nr:Nicotinate-nucleotide adenylyltransferase [Vibrio chagasii]
MTKIGVFGSALNPMTLGHVDAIKQALELCDRVLVVPSFSHAFSKKMKPFDLRVELARKTVEAEFAGGLVEVSTVEQELSKTIEGAIYTYDLLDSLSKADPENEYVFLCGTDNIQNFDAFYKSDEIMNGWSVLGLEERVAIRSTYVRNNVVEGLNIKNMVSSSIESDVKKIYK